MEGVYEGKTLVLGDGNFSFSVALVQRMARPADLTATTLGGEEETLKLFDAGKNTQLLQGKGAIVMFDMDATALTSYLGLHGQIFDHIIFNFPHVGRKAPIKHNRKLLRKFFVSCLEYMSADGRVYVTLCQGQGGTPADQPQRAWHNCWQVVAMAAEAGLIMRDVTPFCAEDWGLYRPSGYRSRDKGFHTEGALTHTFVLGCPLALMTHTAPKLVARVNGQDRCFAKPAGIGHKIGRNLHQLKDHPVAMVTKQLCGLLKDTLGVQHLLEDHSVVCGSLDLQIAGALTEGGAKVRPILVKEEDAEETDGDTCWYLRPSLTTHLPVILQETLQPGMVYILTGEVFSHCVISTHTCPLQHQLLGVVLLPRHTGDTADGSKSTEEDRSSRVDKNTVPATFRGQPNSNIHQEDGSKTSNELKEEDHSIGTDLSEKCTLEAAGGFPVSDMSSCVSCLQQIVSSVLQVDNAVYESPSSSGKSVYLLAAQGTEASLDAPLGQVFLVNKDDLSGCSTCAHVVLCFTLNLDKLTLQKFKIPDIRLLWTEDKRFYSQFLLQADPDLTSITYKEFSKFPPVYRYDISFWENPATDLCEDDFMMLVREVSHDVAADATVIDSYSQPDTGRRSRCYRLTFQAPDRALSAGHVKEIMAELRRRLGQDMGLEVR